MLIQDYKARLEINEEENTKLREKLGGSVEELNFAKDLLESTKGQVDALTEKIDNMKIEASVIRENELKEIQMLEKEVQTKEDSKISIFNSSCQTNEVEKDEIGLQTTFNQSLNNNLKEELKVGCSITFFF